MEPFLTTKGTTGTGLGLWVTQEIIRKHQGSMSVRSSTEPQTHGSVFSVFFPHVEAPVDRFQWRAESRFRITSIVAICDLANPVPGVNGGSVCESNAPLTSKTPIAGFEDRESHRTPFASSN